MTNVGETMLMVDCKND